MAKDIGPIQASGYHESIGPIQPPASNLFPPVPDLDLQMPQLLAQ